MDPEETMKILRWLEQFSCQEGLRAEFLWPGEENTQTLILLSASEWVPFLSTSTAGSAVVSSFWEAGQIGGRWLFVLPGGGMGSTTFGAFICSRR